MEYSAESVRFLHVAYTLMILGQVAYVSFLARRWSRINSDADRLKSTDV